MIKGNQDVKIGEGNVAFLVPHTKQQTKAALLCLLTVFVVLVLPPLVPSPFRAIAMVVGGAASFTLCFSLFKNFLRTRKGSLTPAYGLMAFLWLCAAVVTFLSLTGGIE